MERFPFVQISIFQNVDHANTGIQLAARPRNSNLNHQTFRPDTVVLRRLSFLVGQFNSFSTDICGHNRMARHSSQWTCIFDVNSGEEWAEAALLALAMAAEGK